MTSFVEWCCSCYDDLPLFKAAPGLSYPFVCFFSSSFPLLELNTSHTKEPIIETWLIMVQGDMKRSVQFSGSIVSDSLWPHAPLSCPLPTPELAQTHVHRVSDAIQPSHPLSSPSPPAFNLSQHQGLLQGVSSSHQVAKVLELQLQDQSFQRIFRTDLL